MTRRLYRICPWLLAGSAWCAQIAPPKVPENLKPPGSETVVLKVAGSGKQIYACQASPADGRKFEWVLEKPQADLVDGQGRKVGRHFEGPTWEAADGSRVVGEVEQRANAPRAGAIPWLLLKAKSTKGDGTFGRVTYIQRVETNGGAAPAGGCDQAHAGKEVAIEYQAEYYFYRSGR